MSAARSMLVTVVGPGGRRDLSLPADAPVRELLGPLIDLAGNAGADARPEKWTLSPAAGRPLPPESSLAENGVLDGTVLYLAPMMPDGRAATVPPPAAPADTLTPIQRTEAALPPRHSLSVGVCPGPRGRCSIAMQPGLSAHGRARRCKRVTSRRGMRIRPSPRPQR